MFWNAENLFDCEADSLGRDVEFLPYGIRGWNTSRYRQKISNMYKVFIAAGDWNPPDLIGLCEIENKNVLFDLLRTSPFSYYNYRFVHFDSPDRRGIDVALLYNPETIEVIDEIVIPVSMASLPDSKTRDILEVRVKLQIGDTLSVFVNHWPSKYGGAGFTSDLRENAAEILYSSILKTCNSDPGRKIIVMGDFNDPPESDALSLLTRNRTQNGSDSTQLLVNLALDYKGVIPGSYKFEGAWQMIDQILVNENLISDNKGIFIKTDSYKIFSPDFLLERDEKFGGMKPNRTYTGMVYHGGFSDHLPVIVDLYDEP
jgi:predicted extracellular nuclease